MAEVRMPKMGDGMEEGKILSWLKKEGDHVQEGDSIAEVETDKANVEIPAEETGVLSRIMVTAGQTVPIGAVIAMIGEGSAASAGNGTQAPGAEPHRPASEEKAADREPTRNQGGEPAPREEHARPPVNMPSLEAPTNSPEVERIKASPLARRMASELGIDLAFVRGTGPGGRIVERDLKTYQSGTQEHKPPTPVAMPAEPTSRPAPLPSTSAPALAGQDIRPSKMREAIARRTVQSKQNAPHFYVTMQIEMDRAQALLHELNTDATEGKVTVNDIIVKACAVALGRVPEVNATWTPEGIVRRYAEMHIGVAVGIPEGLIIPVVRDCQSKTLRQISAETKALVEKARANQLKPEEYSGGTFSTSNLGMMGVDEFIAIINPPEAAILAIGGIAREPVVVGDSDEIVIRSRMKVTLSADHRLLDGVVAARFLQEVKKALEAPFSLVA
jgi:pyruvate dehydrogenase E2 component (dihydrolipoamide acetyltransferase)